MRAKVAIKIWLLVYAAASICIFAAHPVSASPGLLVNPNFEIGDLSGWSISVPTGGYTAAVTSYNGIGPAEGRYYAVVKTDGPGSYATLGQTFAASAGETISGWAFFKAADYMPYDDNTQVRVLSGSTVLATVFSASVSTVGDYGFTGWVQWKYVFTATGTYTLEARISNALDSGLDSFMGLDGLKLSVPAPVPALSRWSAFSMAALFVVILAWTVGKRRTEKDRG